MKKSAFLAGFLLIAAGVAFASDYLTGVELQTGNGTNGMTRAVPSLPTDGVAVQSPNFWISQRPIADYAKVTIQASGTNTFQSASNISQLYCYHYAACAQDGGVGFCWARCPYLDIAVDGGQSGVASTWGNTIEFPPVGPLPVEFPGNRYDWAGVNLQQSGAALDAGVWVQIQYITP